MDVSSRAVIGRHGVYVDSAPTAPGGAAVKRKEARGYA